MMRLANHQQKNLWRLCSTALFYNEERYDLSAVGRMKFNRRIGRDELTGADFVG